MTITDPIILTYDYACAAIFAFFYFFFGIAAAYYAITGRERITNISKCSLLIFAICAVCCLIDAGANTFFYIRPSDALTIYWFRQTVSIFILPLLICGFFELLHDPHEDEIKEIGKVKKHINIRHIYSICKWVTVCIALGAEAFILPAVLSNDSSVRWSAFAINAAGGLISLLLVYVYLRYYGMRHSHKHHVLVHTYFYGKNGQAIAALIAWILVLVYWIVREFLLAFGHTLGLYLTYNNEVAGYMSIQLVLIISLILACYAAKKIHYVHAVNIVFASENYKKL